MTRELPWRGKQFMGGYSAEYLPPGQRSWRIIKERGKAKVFASVSQAIRAAQDAYLASVDGKTRASLPVDPDRIAAKLRAEAEDWLQSNRADVKASFTHHRPGKKPFQETRGRARAI